MTNKIRNDWLTVQEVAKYLRLSPEMIYKVIQQENLPAIRIGSSVRIPREEFNTWIQNQKISAKKMNLPQSYLALVQSFQKKLKFHYKDQFVALYIYGSWARGEAHKESDLDTFVVLKKLKDKWKEKRVIEKIAYAVSFGANIPVVISVGLASESDFLHRKDPLFIRIREEGKQAA
ncbi:MAG: helix-turn-helix domain-containing protein [Deltaproteobacteria bacterium]|nr:helix-turn-helix domain-containing protein [Deltaproteobacteria bacterium]